MLVTNLRILSEVSGESEIDVTDGSFVCQAFCHECGLNIGDELHDPLHVFDLKSIQLASGDAVGIQKIAQDRLDQRVTAKLDNIDEGLLSVGGIKLCLDDRIPSDFVDGMFVELECGRIEVW